MTTHDELARPIQDPAIALGMLTYRRLHLLKSAVTSFSEACEPYHGSEELIEDNDPEGSAEKAVHVLAAGGSSPSINYAHEPLPGISPARNRALDEAQGDLLAFIDDDELPTTGWLDKLLDVYRVDQPTAVTGPVHNEFEKPPDPWIVSGGFFARRQNHTGALVREAACNDLLLDLVQVRALSTRFDDRLGLIGGEDNLFSKELVMGGGLIVWGDEAEIIDQVPSSRMSRKWVVKRALLLANTQPVVDLMLAESSWSKARTRVRYVTHGLVRVGVGVGRGLWGAVTRNRTHLARGVRTAVCGSGMLSGAFGHVYAEYTRSTSSTKRMLRLGDAKRRRN